MLLLNRKALNVSGLLCGIVGVVIIFFYGPPQPTFDTGIALGIDGPQVAQHDAQVLAERHRYEFWSRAGLGFILVGFILQFAAEMRTEAEIRHLEQKCEHEPPNPAA